MRRGDRPPGIKRAKAPSAKTVRNIVGTLPGCSPTPSARAGRRATRPAPWTSRRPGRARRSGGSTRRKSTPPPPRPYKHLDRAMYVTAAMTGLRQGELVALLVRDIDWTAGAVRVRRNHVRRIDGTLKSRRSTRTVPMADDVARALEALARDVDDSEDALVFPTPSRAGTRPLRRSCAGCARRSRPPGSTRRTASTTCGTRSAPGWRPTACRCGRCRSGWGTPASRPRSGMPTTRLGTTSGSLCRTRSRDP